jgi:hypothetical protein
MPGKKTTKGKKGSKGGSLHLLTPFPVSVLASIVSAPSPQPASNINVSGTKLSGETIQSFFVTPEDSGGNAPGTYTGATADTSWTGNCNATSLHLPSGSYVLAMVSSTQGTQAAELRIL